MGILLIIKTIFKHHTTALSTFAAASNIIHCAIPGFFLPFSWFDFPAVTTFYKCYRIPWWNFSFWRVLGTESKPAKKHKASLITAQSTIVNLILHRGYTAPPPSAYFFCVSPAFTRIRLTSSTGLGGLVFHAQKDFLMFFHTEFQDSESPSQLRRIFSRSPMSFSVNTKNVFVRFRPIVLSCLKRKLKRNWIKLSVQKTGLCTTRDYSCMVIVKRDDRRLFLQGATKFITYTSTVIAVVSLWAPYNLTWKVGSASLACFLLNTCIFIW